MAIEVVVPRLGWSMDEGTFVEWLKRDGEKVEAGDMLFVLEGEKASQEIESFDAGTLRIPSDAPQPGDEVVVGQLLGYLVGEDEAAPFELEGNGESEGSSSEEPIHQSVKADPAFTPPAARTPDRRSRRTAITPRARRVASELGVDWTNVRGTGVEGRIREQDIRGVALVDDSQPAPKSPRDLVSGNTLPITRMRRTIAERMVAGLHEAAPVTLTTKVDASELVALRDEFRASNGEHLVPTYTDVVLKLVAVAISEHPMISAQWRDDGLFVPSKIHIAFAVDTEAGLVTPVIRDVPDKDFGQIAAESQELVNLARKGQLKVNQMQDGVFTITNLGGYSIDAFTPIINLPQSAILGVGRIIPEPVVVHTGIAASDMMSLSLTFDHRVIDGAPAARFLDRVCALLAEPKSHLMT